MEGKIAYRTVLWAFCIAWGASFCILVGNRLGFLGYGTPLYWALFIPGALSPAIGAWVVLVKNRTMTSKELLATIFAIRQPVRMYLLTLGFIVVYFGAGIVTGIFEYQSFDYVSLLAFPLMIIGGGLEEVGWRYVLNPALERKLPFAVACLVTGVLWSIWHLPFFFEEGSSQYEMNFLVFAIGSIGLSFAYAALYRISKSVWLCVLIHALNNSLYGSFVMKVDEFSTAALPTAVTALILIVASLFAVAVVERKKGTAASG